MLEQFDLCYAKAVPEFPGDCLSKRIVESGTSGGFSLQQYHLRTICAGLQQHRGNSDVWKFCEFASRTCHASKDING